MTKKERNLFIVLIALIGIVAVGLGRTLQPVTLSLLLAYILFPLIKSLEAKGLSRTPATLIAFVLASGLLALIAAFLAPALVHETKSLLVALPTLLSQLMSKAEELASLWNIPLDMDRDHLIAALTEHLTTLSSLSIKSLGSILKNLTSNLLSGLFAIINLILFPLIFFHVIHDFEKIKSFFQSFLSPKTRTALAELLQTSESVFRAYFRGQLSVVLILAAYYAIGLSIARLPFGILVGLSTGFLTFIPYVGVGLGLAASLALALVHGESWTLFGTLICFGSAQLIESFFLTPKIVGTKVGLSPLVTLLSLIIGGNLFGFWGMVIAIPIASVIRTYLRTWTLSTAR